MFYQFGVPEAHRDYLRFFWWKNGDTKAAIEEYRMTVHLFGATSSPGCANYGLKQLADDVEDTHGPDVSHFIKCNFYVDDGLLSVPNVDEAVSILERTRSACRSGGLHLHKFVSNKPEVLTRIEEPSLQEQTKNLDLTGSSTTERALGVIWSVHPDQFEFQISRCHAKPTRRGVLSAVCSVYDPLGLLAPVLLEGKLILQDMCREELDWDSPLPDTLLPRWEQWRNALHELEDLKVQRCCKPPTFGKIQKVELHHFADASSRAYGQCSYLRLVDDAGNVHCSLVLGKSRVAPLKTITISRLELTAAVVSVKISSLLNEELSYSHIENYFWTDSQVVLGYIANEAKRFHVFVANRVQQIRDSTDVSQWRFVKGKDNPADEGSRGLTAKALAGSARWLMGPAFLWERKLPEPTDRPGLLANDPEVKANVMATTTTPETSVVLEALCEISSWNKAQQAVAACLRWKRSHQIHSPGRGYVPCTVEEVEHAKGIIVMLVQIEQLSTVRSKLAKFQRVHGEIRREDVKARMEELKGLSSIYRLDPFLDDRGILRVGGRIKRAEMPYGLKHPAILPKKHHITTLIIRHHHEKVHHQGRSATIISIHI